MELVWKFCDSDLIKVRDFVKVNSSPVVENVINRNIYQNDRTIDKDTILKTMLTCLLASETDSFPEDKTLQLFQKKPFLLQYNYLMKVRDIELTFKEVFQASGVTKYINKVPHYFATNFEYLISTDWKLETEINSLTGKTLTMLDERKLSDIVDRSFKGFGSKEARSFLLALGITRYEIPIDSMMIKWLDRFGFPVKFTKAALQDILFYHFVSDGIQKLCEISEIYPCVLYTSIKSGHNALK